MFVYRKITIICAAILFFVSAGNLSAAEPEGPRLTFSEKRHDFGEVYGDTLLTHVFEFDNTGDDTLRILRVRSS